MQFFVLQFVRTHKNEITILLFVQQKRKHGEMVRVNILFALGVDLTARDAGEGRDFDLELQATPFAVPCKTSSCLCSLAAQV